MSLARGTVEAKAELRTGMQVKLFAQEILRSGEKIRLIAVDSNSKVAVTGVGEKSVQIPDDAWAIRGITPLSLWSMPPELAGLYEPIATSNTPSGVNYASITPITSQSATLVEIPEPNWWFLGQSQDKTWQFAVFLEAQQSKQLAICSQATFAAVTVMGAWLNDDGALLAAQATALANWHMVQKFCSKCGAPTKVSDAGWSVTCTNCGRIEFPRNDPAVIVAISDSADRLLLMHNVLWPQRFVSVLAGFVEAGESPERAVRREVLEEVGLSVSSLTYLGSQPWPKVRSLMLCYSAQVAESTEPCPKPDGVENDWAAFFTRAEFAAAIRTGQIRLPGATAVARSMIENWYGDSLDRLEESEPGLRY